MRRLVSLTLSVVAASCGGSSTTSVDAPGSGAIDGATIDSVIHDGAVDGPISDGTLAIDARLVDAALGIDAALPIDAVPADAPANATCNVTVSGTVTLELNLSTYGYGDYIYACGHAPAGEPATFQVFGPPPNNNLVSIDQITVDSSGLYNEAIMRFPLSDNASYPSGSYTVRITANGGTQVTRGLTYSP
jgi:hypothetical protein